MVSKVSQLSTTNQIVRRRLRVESAQPTKEEELQLRCVGGRVLWRMPGVVGGPEEVGGWSEEVVGGPEDVMVVPRRWVGGAGSRWRGW